MKPEHRWWIRQQMAAQPDADFATLSNDQTHNVRSEVAGNLCTPPDILRKLASDTVADVRLAVAGNPNTPSDALYDLAKDEMFAVRGQVLINPSTSLDIVRCLLPSLGIWACYQVTLQQYFHGVWSNTYMGPVRFLP